MRKKPWLWTVLFLVLGMPYAASGDSYCDGYTSPNNPYVCCAKGNCTWWAWKQASDSWGSNLSGWGNAKTWVESARHDGMIVNPIPAPFTIGVNLTQRDPKINATDGHVVWVVAVSSDGQTITTSEMSCGYDGVQTESRPTAYFTNGGGGFIYPQTHAPTPNLSPGTDPLFITHSANNQTITFHGANLDNTKVVYIAFPNGGHAILQGFGQIPVKAYDQLKLNITFAAPGTWQVMVVGSNGANSNTLYLNIR